MNRVVDVPAVGAQVVIRGMDVGEQAVDFRRLEKIVPDRGEQLPEREAILRRVSHRDLVGAAEIEYRAEARVVVDHQQPAADDQRRSEGGDVAQRAAQAVRPLHEDADEQRQHDEEIERQIRTRGDRRGQKEARQRKQRLAPPAVLLRLGAQREIQERAAEDQP